HRTDAGHDLALGQMPVAHQPPAAIIGELVGMAAEQARNLGLDGLRQKHPRAVAQNLGQRIGKSSWLRELENISLGHGVSLLCWRSGGVEHPHDTPPYPFMPSPTFAHSSIGLCVTNKLLQVFCRKVLSCHDYARLLENQTNRLEIDIWFVGKFGVERD